ncbi:uncharacterized protein LOC122012121 [Zingiber officinale]|uniref:uncharacterized protein LOC122012121 n=1 Tax=Zingiber officinale TaxID=94328 RepID=UPI001C4B78EF|nr:uncharacterized protein LOC122012121 [Zingiber officinale]
MFIFTFSFLLFLFIFFISSSYSSSPRTQAIPATLLLLPYPNRGGSSLLRDLSRARLHFLFSVSSSPLTSSPLPTPSISHKNSGGFALCPSRPLHLPAIFPEPSITPAADLLPFPWSPSADHHSAAALFSLPIFVSVSLFDSAEDNTELCFSRILEGTRIPEEDKLLWGFSWIRQSLLPAKFFDFQQQERLWKLR